MFWDSWESLYRIVILGVLSYAALVIMLRLSGKRTLSKFNAFDFVVTVAFGSVIATILLNSNVSLSEGITALALLIALQFGMTWTSVRSKTWQNLVKSEPALIFHDGNFLHAAMTKERVTREEIHAAMRENGTSKDDTDSVVLETDGTFSVLQKGHAGEAVSGSVKKIPKE